MNADLCPDEASNALSHNPEVKPPIVTWVLHVRLFCVIMCQPVLRVRLCIWLTCSIQAHLRDPVLSAGKHDFQAPSHFHPSNNPTHTREQSNVAHLQTITINFVGTLLTFCSLNAQAEP